MTNSLKKFTVNLIARMCKLSGLSDKSIGVMIRSYHFAMPLLVMMAVPVSYTHLRAHET